MDVLDRAFLEQNGPRLPVSSVGPTDPMPEKIVQFGEGNFLRGFADWHFQEMARRGPFRGSVVVIQPLPEGLIDRLNAQQGIYTLLRRGLRGGQAIEEVDIITVVSRGIDPYRDFGAFMACAAQPSLRIMVSNTTEAGIAYEPVPRPHGTCPPTFPAKVALFLHERYRAFGGAADKGLIVLPCELIERNGASLSECVLRHAADWDLDPGFGAWVKDCNRFCNTLVDRIVPGHPADEMPALAAKLGYEDPLLVASELFHLWVIEGDASVRRELPFTEAGLNVVWTDSLTPYRTLKVRILNGLHTTFSQAAFLAGVDTVAESLDDPLLRGFVLKALDGEILPGLEVAAETARAYAGQVLERFGNPYIKHKLLSIAANSVSKYRVRVLPSVLRFIETRRAAPPALALALAALISFHRGRRSGPRISTGSRGGAPYEIADEPPVLDFFADRSGLYARDRPRLCRETLARTEFWGIDLTGLEGFLPAVSRAFEILEARGAREALESVAGPG